MQVVFLPERNLLQPRHQFPAREIFRTTLGWAAAQLNSADSDGISAAAWLDEQHVHALPNSAIQLYPPIAAMIAHGHWNHIALPVLKKKASCANLMHDIGLISADDLHRAVDLVRGHEDGGEQGQAPEQLMDPGRMHALVRDMRRWCDGLDDPNDVTMMQSYILWLTKTAESLDCLAQHGHVLTRLKNSAEWKGRSVEGLVGKHGFKTVHLIEVIMHCSLLKNKSQVAESLKSALRILLPPDLSASLLREADKLPIPSDYVLSRFQLALDTGYMMWMRDRFRHIVETHGVIFSLSDSSPQGGRDWLLSEQYVVSSLTKPGYFRPRDRHAHACWRAANTRS